MLQRYGETAQAVTDDKNSLDKILSCVRSSNRLSDFRQDGCGILTWDWSEGVKAFSIRALLTSIFAFSGRGLQGQGFGPAREKFVTAADFAISDFSVT